MTQNIKYAIALSEKEGFLEVVITGEVTRDTVERLAVDVANLVIDNGAKNILVDVRAMKGRLGVLETYAIIRNPYEKPNVNCAVVDLPENAEMIKFLETTSLNAGLLLKCFTNIHAARAWLKKFQNN